MLRIYTKKDLQYFKHGIEDCPSYINIWEVEMNKQYKLKESL